MSHPLAGATLMEISKMPGVADLKPMKVKAGFAQALKAEAEGRTADAETTLNSACEAEAQA